MTKDALQVLFGQALRVMLEFLTPFRRLKTPVLIGLLLDNIMLLKLNMFVSLEEQ